MWQHAVFLYFCKVHVFRFDHFINEFISSHLRANWPQNYDLFSNFGSTPFSFIDGQSIGLKCCLENAHGKCGHAQLNPQSRLTLYAFCCMVYMDATFMQLEFRVCCGGQSRARFVKYNNYRVAPTSVYNNSVRIFESSIVFIVHFRSFVETSHNLVALL